MIGWVTALFRLVKEYRRVEREHPGEQPLWRLLQGASYAAKDLPRVEGLATDALATAQAANKLIYDRTTVHADISPGGRDPNVVILVGSYRGRDYVQCYSMDGRDFTGILEHLREASRHTGRIGRIDAPPAFRAVIDRDLKF